MVDAICCRYMHSCTVELSRDQPLSRPGDFVPQEQYAALKKALGLVSLPYASGASELRPDWTEDRFGMTPWTSRAGSSVLNP